MSRYTITLTDAEYDALNDRIAQLEAALQLIGNELSLHADQGPAGEAFRALLVPTLETPAEPNYRYQEPSNLPAQSLGIHPTGGPCIHVYALTNRSAFVNGKCEICGNSQAKIKGDDNGR